MKIASFWGGVGERYDSHSQGNYMFNSTSDTVPASHFKLQLRVFSQLPSLPFSDITEWKENQKSLVSAYCFQIPFQ